MAIHALGKGEQQVQFLLGAPVCRSLVQWIEYDASNFGMWVQFLQGRPSINSIIGDLL